MTNIKIFFGIIIILFLGIITTVILKSNGSVSNAPDKYDDFAICLKDKGAVFYGAFWCSHCKAQKKMFGPSAKLLPYVECSTLNGSGQLPICVEKDIKGYPTWEFADGSRLTGEISFEQLSEKTSCPIPLDIPQN